MVSLLSFSAVDVNIQAPVEKWVYLLRGRDYGGTDGLLLYGWLSVLLFPLPLVERRMMRAWLCGAAPVTPLSLSWRESPSLR